MNLWIKKVAPTMAVLAVLVYCSWPGVEEALDNNKAKDKDKKRAISQTSLAPQAAPLPKRDPFESVAKKRDPTKGLAKKTPTPKETAKAASLAQTLSASEELKKQAASLALKGTFLSGERRLAVINDSFYAEGEVLRSAKLKAPVRIAEVYPDTVVLELHGARVILKYREKDGKDSLSAKADRKTAKVNDTKKK